VEGGGGGLTVSGVSRNRGGFVKCVAIQKWLGIPDLGDRKLLRWGPQLHRDIFSPLRNSNNNIFCKVFSNIYRVFQKEVYNFINLFYKYY
jgi:hypothetical protein